MDIFMITWQGGYLPPFACSMLCLEMLLLTDCPDVWKCEGRVKAVV